MSSKIVLKSKRIDVRALDELFHALRDTNLDTDIRVLRFYCQSQGITGQHLFPEDYRK